MNPKNYQLKFFVCNYRSFQSKMIDHILLTKIFSALYNKSSLYVLY